MWRTGKHGLEVRCDPAAAALRLRWLRCRARSRAALCYTSGMPTRVSAAIDLERELLVEYAAQESRIESQVVAGFFVLREWLDPKQIPSIAGSLAQIGG